MEGICVGLGIVCPAESGEEAGDEADVIDAVDVVDEDGEPSHLDTIGSSERIDELMKRRTHVAEGPWRRIVP